jgi:hypothetical protein
MWIADLLDLAWQLGLFALIAFGFFHSRAHRLDPHWARPAHVAKAATHPKTNSHKKAAGPATRHPLVWLSTMRAASMIDFDALEKWTDRDPANEKPARKHHKTSKAR